MARKPERKNLGRGLSALLGDAATPVAVAPRTEPATTSESDTRITSLPIETIRPNPKQPRRSFDEKELTELSDSIREHGIIQPVIVRPDPEKSGIYQIVAGERRWRAAQKAQLHTLPVVLRELSEQDVLELALIENIQRADLNPIEEAAAYAQLIEAFSYTQEALAKSLGKSRPYIANSLRLLSLPDAIQGHVRDGRITAGHARALVTAADPLGLAEEVIAKGLTVRQTEDLARRIPKADIPKPVLRAPEKDADTRQLEGDLSAALMMKVSINHSGDGGGEIKIRYKDLDQLDNLLQKLAI